jgi:adenylate kinase
MHLVFLGPPACGKGTQSAILVKQYGYYHLSTGDLMRTEVATGSELGKTIKLNIEKGVLAASEIVNELLKKDVENHKQMSILFDGYPRKIDQAKFLDSVLEKNKGTLKSVFYFDIDAEELFQRILSRVTCKACGAVYNLRTNPPKEDGVCDSCGSHELVRRGDDNEEILKNRIQSFFEETAPLKEFYQKRGILTVINAREPVEIVTEQIINAL